MKGYVINLDRRPDRLKSFYSQTESGIFERIPAIDRNVLALLPHKDFIFNSEKNRKEIGRECGRETALSEIACTLSHTLCWKKIAESPELSDDDFAIVAEDDVALCDGAISAISEKGVVETFPLFADIILLQTLHHYFADKFFDKTKHQYFQFIKFEDPIHYTNYGSSLYLMRKRLAKTLTARLENTKPNWVADQFIRFCSPENILYLNVMLGYVPPERTGADSDIDPDRLLTRGPRK